MSTTILYFAFQILLFVLWMLCFHILFEPRFPLRLNLPLEVLGFVLFALLCIALPLQSLMRTLGGALFLLLLFQFLFRGRWYSKLVFSLVVLLIMVLSELLAFLFLPQELTAEQVLDASFPSLLTIYLVDFFGNFVMLFAALILSRYFKERSRGLVPQREWLLLLLFPLSQYVLLTGWFPRGGVTVDHARLEYLALTILLCIGSDIALYLTLNASARSAQIKARNELLQAQIDSQQEYYKDLAGYYESLRRLRHDISNHMYTIGILLEEGRTAEAGEYAAELRQTGVPGPQLANCDNPVVDSFLAHRRDALQSAGIRLELDLALPYRCAVTNSDMICLLGNLLDNAAEACAQTEEKRILLTMRYAAPYLYVETRNASKADPRPKKRRIPELERGVGFGVLRHLARKYDGSFQTEDRDGSFHVRLTLKSQPSEG